MLSLVLWVLPLILLPFSPLAAAHTQACGDIAKHSAGTARVLEDCYWRYTTAETTWIGAKREGPVSIMRFEAEPPEIQGTTVNLGRPCCA
jgi:hypothetical protein